MVVGRWRLWKAGSRSVHKVSSNSFVLAIECISFDAGVERRELALNMRVRPNKFT
jgi:hypothetical protein